MSDGLTIRQDKLAREYVKTGLKAQSAIKAGYSERSAHVIANETLKIPKVAEHVQRLRNQLAEKLDISRERLLNNAAHMAEEAHAKGEYGPAIKATELVMKAQGYLVEKSLNMNVDVTQQHLDALQAYTDRRIEERMNERMAEVSGSAEISTHASASHENVCTRPDAQDNDEYRSMDVMEHPTHVDEG